jgi:hypothetical protein
MSDRLAAPGDAGRYAPAGASAVAWSPAGTGLRVSTQGREQLGVGCDGVLLRRDTGAVICPRQVVQADRGPAGGLAGTWNGSWNGAPGIPALPVPSVRFPVLSVQLMRPVDEAMFMVRRRSTVRFRNGAPAQRDFSNPSSLADFKIKRLIKRCGS